MAQPIFDVPPRRDTVLLHLDQLHLLTCLSLEGRGKVISCLLHYLERGGVKHWPEAEIELGICDMDGREEVVLQALTMQADREYARYQERAEKRRAAARARWDKEPSKAQK